MARLTNINSGAIVSCSDETAAQLGSEWESADTKKAAAKKASSTNSK